MTSRNHEHSYILKLRTTMIHTKNITPNHYILKEMNTIIILSVCVCFCVSGVRCVSGACVVCDVSVSVCLSVYVSVCVCVCMYMSLSFDVS